MEGKEWSAVNDDKGKTTERVLTVSITNNSQITDKRLNKFVTNLQKDFAKTYGADGGNARLVISDKATIKISVVNVKGTIKTDADGNETKTALGGNTAKIGDTQNNSFSVTASIDGDNRSIGEMTRAFEHEAGHTAGLRHPFDPQQGLSDVKQGAKGVKAKTIRNNLMNSDANPTNPSNSGRKLIESQFQSMDKLIESQQPKK